MDTTCWRRTCWRTFLLLALVTADACGVAPARAADVLLDGRFDDWAGATRVVDDPADAPGATVDIGAVEAQADARWLYLALDLGREVNAQALPGTLHLLFDTTPGVGAEVYGMSGVDLVLELSPFANAEAGARGLGLALRPVGADGPGNQVSAYALQVVVQPGMAASRIEMRVSRAGSIEPTLPRMGSAVGLKAVYVEARTVVDETAEGTYRFRTAAGAVTTGAPANPGERMARAAGTVRVAQWNVSGESLRNRPGDFARVLAALDADVLLLNELPGEVTDSELTAFFAREPMRGRGSWSFALGAAGGRQRAVVAARGLPLRAAEAMHDIRYAPGSLDALQDVVGDTFREAIDLERVRGVSASGAWVDLGRGDVLFAALDLQSAGWQGSPQDLLRTLQAETIRERIDEAVAGRAGAGSRPVEAGPASVVVGGDFNLVGSIDPLVTIGRGLDTGADLATVEALRLGERTLVTWRNPEQPFGPGRLDYLMLPASVLEVVNSFVFATDDLDSATLEALRLEPLLSSQLSDHLVVVADLRQR